MPNIESGLGHASLSAMGIDFEDKELVRTLLAVPSQPLASELNVLAAQVQAAGLASIGTPIGAGAHTCHSMLAGGLLRFLARQHVQDNLDELATVKLKRICTLSAS